MRARGPGGIKNSGRMAPKSASETRTARASIERREVIHEKMTGAERVKSGEV
jgi:hypothetical protein